MRIKAIVTLRSHYDKIVCACCLFTLFVNVGFVSTSFNVYQPYIADAIGHEPASNVLLVRTLVSLLAMLFVTRWYELVDCRVGIFVATLFSAAGFFAYSFATGFWSYCIGAVLAGAGYGFGSMVAVTMLIGRWFETHRGIAMGVAATGSSLSGIILPVVVTYLAQNVGLAWAYRAEAALAVLVAVCVFLLLRNRPSDVGFVPHGAVQEGSLATQAEVCPAFSHTLTKTQRRLMVFAMVCMGCVAVDGWNYLSILMINSGFDHYFAALFVAVGSVGMVVGKVSSGALMDKIGVQRGSAVFFVLLMVGLALCSVAFMGNQVFMGLGAVILGAGISLGTVGISVWSLDLSGPETAPKLIKDLQVAYAFGGFIFNLLPGRIVEAGGSYSISYAIMIVLCAVMAAIVLGIYAVKSRGTCG